MSDSALPLPPSAVDPAPFEAALGAGAIRRGEAATAYAVDGRVPELAVRPASLPALAEALGMADARGLAVILHGGGTSVALGNPPQRYALALDTRNLDAVVAYEPDDLTVTVQAGMPFATLQALLAEHRQFVPLDVPQAAIATVGGALAAARTGPRRAIYGSARDWLIGCQVATADGTLIRGGGRVVKNVSGYDLCKLFVGSFGTLGCLVEASFKLRPLPDDDQTLLLPAPDFTAALRLGRTIAQHVHGLQAVVALDRATAAMLGLDGAAVLLRAGGVREAVAALLREADNLAGGAVRPYTSDARQWQAITDLEGTDPGGTALLVRCGVPPARLPDAAAALCGAAAQARLWAYADSGLIFAQLPAPTATLLPAMVRTARAAIESLDGSLVVERAPLREKPGMDLWGSAGDGLAIMRRVKQQFDPNATLSPGRFVGGL